MYNNSCESTLNVCLQLSVFIFSSSVHIASHKLLIRLNFLKKNVISARRSAEEEIYCQLHNWTKRQITWVPRVAVWWRYAFASCLIRCDSRNYTTANVLAFTMQCCACSRRIKITIIAWIIFLPFLSCLAFCFYSFSGREEKNFNEKKISDNKQKISMCRMLVK